MLVDCGRIIPGGFSWVLTTRKHVRWSSDDKFRQHRLIVRSLRSLDHVVDRCSMLKKIWRCTSSFVDLHLFSFARLKALASWISSLYLDSLRRQAFILTVSGACKSMVDKKACSYWPIMVFTSRVVSTDARRDERSVSRRTKSSPRKSRSCFTARAGPGLADDRRKTTL